MGKKAGLHSFIPRPPACLKQFADENFDGNKVEEEAKSIQNRLREIFTQVWDENATFQRIMYKNQNQHRRTMYFRRLVQVRRDLLLLQSFGLKDVVETLSHCVSFSKQKALPSKALLGSLGQGLQSKDHLISTVQRRLLGAARLLQLMADPILNAGLAIQGLLSQSFFMPFALTVMALLARFRVLLIQALYELIAALNLVSAFMQKMEIPSVQPDVPLFLECRWDGVKLVVLEKTPPPRPPPPPQELIPLPSSVSQLPDAGWFIDDRSTLVQEKLQSTGALERVENFILEDSQFELLGDEDDVEAAGVVTPTLGSAISSMEAEVSSGIHEVMHGSSIDITGLPVSTPSSSRKADISLGKRKSVQDLKSDVRAELESWRAELESWGSKVDKGVEETCTSDEEKTKQRVAYVSVQVGGAKESKILKTRHPI